MGMDKWLEKIAELENKRAQDAVANSKKRARELEAEEQSRRLRAKTVRLLKTFIESEEGQQIQKLLRLLGDADIEIYSSREVGHVDAYFFSGFGIRHVKHGSIVTVLPPPLHKSSARYDNAFIITPEEFVGRVGISGYKDPEWFCKPMIQRIRTELDELIK